MANERMTDERFAEIKRTQKQLEGCGLENAQTGELIAEVERGREENRIAMAALQNVCADTAEKGGVLMATTLDACKHCGGEAKLIQDGLEFWCVFCTMCDITTLSVEKEAAIAAWNRKP